MQNVETQCHAPASVALRCQLNRIVTLTMGRSVPTLLGRCDSTANATLPNRILRNQVLMSGNTKTQLHQQLAQESSAPQLPKKTANKTATSSTATTAEAAAPGVTVAAPKATQPSLATLMMLKRRIGDLRARHKRNRPVRRVENSYRLGPDPVSKYPPGEVRVLVENSLRFFLAESRYDAKVSPKLAKMVTEDVKRRMKNNFSCPRYKIIVLVTVAQRAQQQLLMASRTVADSEHDDFVTCTLGRPTFLACATVFWFYCE